VAAGAGEVARADEVAGEVAAAAGKAGLVPVQLEGQLLQGQLARESGQEARGAQLVSDVRARAEQSGLGLLSRKASG
jgi:hypothetical protein